MNILYTSLLLSIIVGTSVFAGCSTSEEKVDAAQEEVVEANENLNEAEEDAKLENQKVASAEEWKAFKQETELQINENEAQITRLKSKMNQPGKIFDNLYAKKINGLEEKNSELRSRMNAYEKKQSDWESFKTEFNHDLNELGTALKDLTVNNKK